MSHEKRFLLAIGLTVAFMYVWFQYFVPKPPIAPTTTEATPSVPAGSTPASNAPGTSPAASIAPSIKGSLPIPAQERTFSGELWSTQLTNQPGSVKAVELAKYRQEAKKDSPLVKVVPMSVETQAPLTWEYQIAGQSIHDQDLFYAMKIVDENTTVFTSAPTKDIQIRKTWTVDPKTYAYNLKLDVTSKSLQTIKFGARTYLTSVLSENDHAKSGFFKQRATPVRVATYMDGTSHHWTVEEVAKGPKVPVGDIAWAGFDSQYFLMAALPEEGRWESLALTAANKDTMQVALIYPTWDLESSKPLSYGVKLYAGPKDITLLQKVGPSLDRAIDLGDWLGLVARPMIRFLRFAYSLIPNYGVAIILLTVLVRLLLTPFTQMQAKSMRKMQEHKPAMDALKEKFKDNKEAHSRELMTYMRTNKINPMGGCLLLLPQLPIFFALYRVLYNSIELRHEPFVFWIKDLAAHDPYFVLPVLLGIAMFFQQKLTPNPTADEAQQTMMKIMPIMFTMFMLFLPAGLCLYIFVSTLWGVIQQYKIQQGSTMALTQPIKKVGS